MRAKGKIIVWPVYFDSTKTRSKGRKISKHLAVPNPKLDEIYKAAKSAGFESQVVLDRAYPKTPWRRTGMLLISKKDGSKLKILKEIGKRLNEVRGQTKH